MSAAQYLYRKYILPAGTMVQIRKVSEGTRPEVTVRNVNEDDELSAHEYSLRLDFVLKYGKAVRLV